MHKYIYASHHPIQSNPIQSNPIQSNWIKQSNKAEIDLNF